MKVRTGKQLEKATRVFTDREEPRAAFWKKYEEVQKEISGDNNIHVLTYYGIGGIGKSTLLKKLISEMKERLANPRCVYFDFNNIQKSRAVLSNISNYMAENFNFTTLIQ
ncbi:MAG: hypothetical protein IJY55_02595 [Clostridia bacterium]|nr:hypothetical protein [Clostridia bacterium]